MGIVSGAVLLFGSAFACAAMYALYRLMNSFDAAAQKTLELHAELTRQISEAANLEVARFREACKARAEKPTNNLKPKPGLTEDDRAVE